MGSRPFQDHFSAAAGYAQYRPSYPGALFEFLAESSPGRGLAWDCATGTGQVARCLAGRFSRVIATDASLGQLGRVPLADTGVVEFAAASAEAAPIADYSVDLITVGQALHWFDFASFYREVQRVAGPGAVLAAWTYPLMGITPQIDREVRRFSQEVVGAFWPPERRYVDELYKNVPFPFERIETPPFETAKEWNLADLLGYLGTWSSVNRFRSATEEDPLPALAAKLERVWGDRQQNRRAVWKLALLAGKVG